MRIDVLTIFPEVCRPYFSASILQRAQDARVVAITCHDIRDYTDDPHNKVDDRPFGGGPGMVMTCQPVFTAVEAIETGAAATRILLTPQGERFTQAIAEQLSQAEHLLLIAGHYEGFDERIRLGLQPREISIGDFVLSGGEAAAMVVVDAVVRLLPGAVGHEDATIEESFSLGGSEPGGAAGAEGGYDVGCRLLEYPQYTRPREFRGMAVPEVLLSGDHAKIQAWRRAQSMLRTRQRRPDLLASEPPAPSEGPRANTTDWKKSAKTAEEQKKNS